MKKLLTFSLIIFAMNSIAQTAISDVTGYTPNPKAVLDVNSTTKGLLLPRLTTAQRIAIAPTASQAGLTVFDTNTKSQWFFDGTVWKEMAGGFSLPYSGTNSDGNNALDISNTVGRAAYFQSPNTAETMRVYNSGSGDAIMADGHLNVSGTIKTNGIDGTTGQILQNNGNGTMSWVTKNQSGFSVFGSGGLSITPTSPFTLIPGLTQTITVPSNAVVYVTSVGGLNTTSATAAGFSVVDIIFVVDGAIVANGGYQRVYALNSSSVVGVYAYWSLATVLTLAAGSHTIQVHAGGTSAASASNATVSGSNISTAQATLNVLILK